jgi:integrase
LVPPSVYHGLRAVSGLQKGRTEARKPKPVKPIPEPDFVAVRPFVSRQVWAMIELQRLTGMRPGEVVAIRYADLDTSNTIWVYRPRQHKTAQRDRDRTICLGPRAQDVLKPWLKAEANTHLFNPAEARTEPQALRRRKHQSDAVEGKRSSRATLAPNLPAGDHYSVRSDHHAIQRACCKAGVRHRHPNQLRHLTATRIRQQYDLEAAQVILGHAKADVTVYTERALARAMKIVAQFGVGSDQSSSAPRAPRITHIS